MIFRSEWTKLKYTLNLGRCFLLHSTKFQYFFFYGFKSQLSKGGGGGGGGGNIWKECFARAILSFSIPRCAIIARLNVIYTKFRRAMIAQLNKIWRLWACARAITRNSRPGLVRIFFFGTTKVYKNLLKISFILNTLCVILQSTFSKI